MFSVKDDNCDYNYILKPPSGYRLNALVATSFSVDLRFIRALLLKIANNREVKDDNDLQRLFSLDTLNNKVFIICNRGQIYPIRKKHKSDIDPLLDNFLYEIKVDNKYSCFHPKIILQHFTPGRRLEGNARNRIRLSILSRNLSNPANVNLEMQYTAEGEVNDKQRDVEPEAINLKRYLMKVFIKAGIFKVNKIDALLSDLDKTVFDYLPERSKKGSFRFIFNHPELNKNVEEVINQLVKIKHDKSIVISPFLSANILNKLMPSILISTKEEYLKEKIQKYLDVHRDELTGNIYHVACYDHESTISEEDRNKDEQEVDDDTVVPNEAGNISSEDDDEAIEDNAYVRGLHAKMMIAKDGKDAYLFLGSSNFTNRGMEKNGNWEANILLGIKSQKNRNAFDELKNEILYSDPDEDKLYPFINRYDIPPADKYKKEKPSKKDELIKEYESLIHRLKSLAKYKIGRVKGRDNLIALTIQGSPNLSSVIPSDNKLRIDFEIEGCRKNDVGMYSFDTIGNVSEFVVVKMFHKGYDNFKKTFEEFTVKGDFDKTISKKERDNDNKNNIFKSRDDFHEYALLKIGNLEGLSYLKRNKNGTHNGKRMSNIMDVVGVEAIVKALMRDSDAFKQIDSLVKLNRALDEDKRDKNIGNFWKICSQAYIISELGEE